MLHERHTFPLQLKPGHGWAQGMQHSAALQCLLWRQVTPDLQGTHMQGTQGLSVHIASHALRHAALLRQPHSLATLSRPAAGAQPAPAAGSCPGRPPGGVGCLLVAAHSCWRLMARRRCSNGGAWEGGHGVASAAAGCLMWGCHQARQRVNRALISGTCRVQAGAEGVGLRSWANRRLEAACWHSRQAAGQPTLA